ncbi:MAG: hypothetical protein GXO98_06645 [Nitrospirae bacterium]|nr:hypothetical protein [Nitrospirota bacterium]
MGRMVLTVSCFILFLFPTIGCGQMASKEQQVFSVTQDHLKLTLKKVSIAEIFDENRREELQVDVWCFLERTDGKPINNEDNVTLGGFSLVRDKSERIPYSNVASTMYQSTSVPLEYKWLLGQEFQFSDNARLFHGSLLVKKKDLANLSKLNIHIYMGLTNRDGNPEPFVFEDVRLPGR